MFYRAMVEDNNDPKQIGRVKVRVFGIHDDSNVNTADLAWAEVAGGTEFGLVSGVGVSSILRKGTMVWVFFKEDDSNYPVVFATVKGINSGNSDSVFKDPDGVYPKRPGSDLHPNSLASYGKIATLETESGHLIELDDTEGNEQIKVTHKTGSNILIDKDGNIQIYSKKDIIYTVDKDVKWNITGKLEINSKETKFNSGTSFGVTAAEIDFD